MNFIKQNWPVLLTLLAFIGILIYSIIKQDSRDILFSIVSIFVTVWHLKEGW